MVGEIWKGPRQRISGGEVTGVTVVVVAIVMEGCFGERICVEGR